MAENQPALEPSPRYAGRRFVARIFRRLLIAGAIGAALICVWYGIENYRGRKAWAACEKKLFSQGAKIDFKALIPPRVPDEENFAATLFFRDLDFKTAAEMLPGSPPTNADPHGISSFALIESKAAKLNRPASSRKRDRNLTDCAAWDAAFEQYSGPTRNDLRASFVSTNADTRLRAADALRNHLKAYDRILEELRIASKRPHSRFEVDYHRKNPWEILLPHLVRLKWVCKVASLRACAELAGGRSEEALQDVLLMFRVIDAVKSEPILMSYVVRTACLELAVQPVWEGLALDNWSDAQLHWLQSEIGRFNFMADEQNVLEAERAVGISTPDLFYRYPREMLSFATPVIGAYTEDALTVHARSRYDRDYLLISLAPRGWWRREQCNYVQMFERYILGGVDFSNSIVNPAAVDANRDELGSKCGFEGSFRSAVFNHRLIAGLLLPTVISTHSRAAYAETVVRHVVVACALERYRRKESAYPQELKALENQFLKRVPHDVIGGGPMKYKPTERFLLYSVGWDQNDDGGRPTALLSWESKGDWVWSYPE